MFPLFDVEKYFESCIKDILCNTEREWMLVAYWSYQYKWLERSYITGWDILFIVKTASAVPHFSVVPAFHQKYNANFGDETNNISLERMDQGLPLPNIHVEIYLS